jgi:uncharacterized protein YndB with AHSA1/START domain
MTITLTSRSIVPAPPERIWDWFARMDEHYRAWHPDHVVWRTERGSPVTVGSVVYFHERIGWAPVAMRCRIVEARPAEYLRYEALFPHSLVGAGGSFALTPVDGGSEVTVEARMGLRAPPIGPLLDALLRAVFPMRQFQQHLSEEGRNLTAMVA